jgi:hypothetical protein
MVFGFLVDEGYITALDVAWAYKEYFFGKGLSLGLAGSLLEVS